MIFLLFRKRNSNQHSIERVFETLLPFLRSNHNVSVTQLPFSNSGLINKIKNIKWTSSLPAPIHISGDVYYACLFSRQKILLTIHDIGVLQQVGLGKKWFIRLFWFILPAKKAKKLVFISETSRNEFLKICSVDVEKTCVIHNPLPIEFGKSEMRLLTEKPVILQLGTKNNKNLHRLIKALSGIPCILMVVGKLSEAQRISLKLENIEFKEFHNVTVQELVTLYSEADVVSFVSLYEGFGMPIIEAQASGRPVVTSNLSSMPEVAGEGACLVDPYDVEDIRKGISKVLADKEYREDLIKKGFENIKRFKPEVIAQQYMDLYKEVFGFEKT